MGKRVVLHGVAPIVLVASNCVCTMPRRFFHRFAESLDLFTPPVTLPPTQLLALWHPRCQDDGGHVWLRERLYAAAGRV